MKRKKNAPARASSRTCLLPCTKKTGIGNRSSGRIPPPLPVVPNITHLVYKASGFRQKVGRCHAGAIRFRTWTWGDDERRQWLSFVIRGGTCSQSEFEVAAAPSDFAPKMLTSDCLSCIQDDGAVRQSPRSISKLISTGSHLVCCLACHATTKLVERVAEVWSWSIGRCNHERKYD